MTFVLYKSYFGKDLLSDVVDFAKKNASAIKLDPNNLTLDNLGNFSFDTEFILQLFASLMAVTLDGDSISVWLYISNAMVDIGFSAAQSTAASWHIPATAGRDGLLVWWGTADAIAILNYARDIGPSPDIS